MSESESIKSALVNMCLGALGLALALTILEVGLRLGGWYLQSRQDAANSRALRQKAEVTILCLGESTTAGAPPHGDYPSQLEKILNDKGLGVRFRVINGGLSGGRTYHIVAALDKNLRQYNPDIVITMMGVNDYGQTYSYGGLLGDDSPAWFKELRVYKLYRLLSVAIGSQLGLQGDYKVGRYIVREKSRYPERLSAVPEAQDDRMRTWAQEALTRARASGSNEADSKELERLVHSGDGSDADQFEKLLGYYKARNDLEAMEALYRLRLAYLDSVTFTSDRGRFERLQYFRTRFAGFLENRGKFAEAEEVLLDLVTNVEPGNFRLYPPLIQFYERRKNGSQAAKYEAERNEVINSYISPVTLKNYDIVRERVLGQGRILLAVQYPTRSLDVLKRLTRYDSRIGYVSNEFFSDLIVQDGYDTYFYDRFGVDFGHLTQRGNYVLASHIAQAVEALLGKPQAGGKPGR
jgi:lysophospholipase L1-like esterase